MDFFVIEYSSKSVLSRGNINGSIRPIIGEHLVIDQNTKDRWLVISVDFVITPEATMLLLYVEASR